MPDPRCLCGLPPDRHLYETGRACPLVAPHRDRCPLGVYTPAPTEPRTTGGRRPGVSPGSPEVLDAHLPAIRIASEDRARVDAKAQAAGVTVSEWVRGVVLERL